MNEIKVSNPQHEILCSTEDRVLFLAGQGSGKTFEGGLLSAEFIINQPHMIGFIGANTYSQLSKSTLKGIFECWQKVFGWVNGIDYVVDKIPPPKFKRLTTNLKDYSGTICFNNGCIIFTASLDNYKAIDGMEIGWAILDETKDTKEEAVKEVITGRLRQIGMWVGSNGLLYNDSNVVEGLKLKGATFKGYNPLFILTSPAKVDWINEWYGLSDDYEEISKRIFSKTDYYSKKKDGKHVVISSAYHNEENLSQGFIEQRIKDLTGNENRINMLIYGSPIAKGGGELFNQFERMTHVAKVPYVPGANLHISLDFNVVPYITMLCAQIINKEGKFTVRIFREICLSSPKNNTEDLCKELITQVIQGNEKTGLYYYGDASGSNANTVSKDHNFDVLEKTLKKYLNDSSKRVLKRNPSVSGSRDFCNKIFAGGFNIEILIDESCKRLITDFEFLKEGPDGGKLIQHHKDIVTGQQCEKYGHTSDAFRYLLISAFEGYFKNFD